MYQKHHNEEIYQSIFQLSFFVCRRLSNIYFRPWVMKEVDSHSPSLCMDNKITPCFSHITYKSKKLFLKETKVQGGLEGMWRVGTGHLHEFLLIYLTKILVFTLYCLASKAIQCHSTSISSWWKICNTLNSQN